MKLGIIGSGRMGTALGSALGRVGHQVMRGSRTGSRTYREAARYGEAVVLATPWPYTIVPGTSPSCTTSSRGPDVAEITLAQALNARYFVFGAIQQTQYLVPAMPQYQALAEGKAWP